MTNLIQLTDKHYAVKVPQGASGFKLHKPYKYHQLEYNLPSNLCFDMIGGESFLYKDFGGSKHYPESLKIAFLANTATEEDWKRIVEPAKGWFDKYKNYLDGGMI